MAWRAWRWNGTTLQGVVVAWPESELEAKCATCHEPPDWEHTCGIYAVRDQSGLALLSAAGISIVGKVELSGLVVEHESGYRARHVRILELWVPSMAISRQINEAYADVEVHIGRPQIEGEELPMANIGDPKREIRVEPQRRVEPVPKEPRGRSPRKHQSRLRNRSAPPRRRSRLLLVNVAPTPDRFR